MQILYLDNIKGFAQTYFPLKDVNFFIGENSTGKSTVMKLVSFISSPGFWQYQPFINSYIGNPLGNFNEIITRNSNNQYYFDIGILVQESNGDFSAIKIRFIEDYQTDTKLPILKEVSLLNRHLNCQASIEGESLKFRYRLINGAKDNDVFATFRSWIEDNSLGKEILRKINIQFVSVSAIIRQIQTTLLQEVSIGELQLSTEALTDWKLPTFLNRIAVFDPVRIEPKKTYSTPATYFKSSGEHTPYILNEIFENSEVQYILKRFGEDSGLYDDIKIERATKNDTETPFEILVLLNDKWLNLYNVGYGVSQVLPFLIEIIARPQDSWYALQQPEIHLHPRAQAAFGDFIYKACLRDSGKFVIETHSDYLIDRFRLRINRAFREEAPIALEDIGQVVFFQRSEYGNQINVINIQADGSYPEDQPVAFRDFFIKEQLNLIQI